LPAFLVAVLAAPCGAARADDLEQRDYVIRVDGKQAGRSSLTIVQKDDGTTHVEGAADVKVTWLGFNAFSYSVRSKESWGKNGQLVSLRSSATEDGKQTEVEVSSSAGQLALRVNGKAGTAPRPDVWTSSYWKLADAKFHNKGVPILDADTGKLLTGQLDFVGMEKIKVGAQLEDCFRFKVTGIPVPINLWFDPHHRLVRQEFTESGYRTIVELLAVRRLPKNP
jgi:hypothetical protein